MTDMDNVKKAWECCNPFKRKCNECPYEKDCYHDGISRHMVADAIALLKEQENKKLIDADKLREKLGFAEYCEDCKRDSWKCGCATIYSLRDFCATIDIAIEELMQEGR